MRIRNENAGYTAEPAPDLTGIEQDLGHWLTTQTGLGPQVWLLAHAVDGVIWGRLDAGTLTLSGDVYASVSPKLRNETLLEARLFGANAEVHLWRSGSGFAACRVSDVDQAGALAFDEIHRLWGTMAEGRKDGFTLLADGREGLRHAFPIDVPNNAFGRTDSERYRPAVLRTRHYLDFDSDGRAVIAASRLVELIVETRGAKKEGAA